MSSQPANEEPCLTLGCKGAIEHAMRVLPIVSRLSVLLLFVASAAISRGQVVTLTSKPSRASSELSIGTGQAAQILAFKQSDLVQTIEARLTLAITRAKDTWKGSGQFVNVCNPLLLTGPATFQISGDGFCTFQITNDFQGLTLASKPTRGGDDYFVPPGQIAQLVSYHSHYPNDGNPFLYITRGQDTWRISIPSVQCDPMTIAGPAALRIEGDGFCTLRLSRIHAVELRF